MIGGTVESAPATMDLGVFRAVGDTATATAQFALNGPARAANAGGDHLIVESQSYVVLNLVTLCFGEGCHGGFSFCLSN